MWLSLAGFSVPVLFQLPLSISHAFQKAGVAVFHRGTVMLLCWSELLIRDSYAVFRSGACQKHCGTPRPCSGRGRSASGVPGYKPTLWERRFLLWAGNFKKLEDIPETVSLDTVQAAKTNLRIKFSYVMIALTIVGCITMVIRGKQGMKRHESLTNINLEKKAQWKAEGASAKP
uniref:Family with sequence similarity 162 member A n=1 Tax=Taeniopygia guttata TaxID=59729 RepID=A0A674GIH1_TAEGU